MAGLAAGIIDQDIDPAEPVHHGADHPVDLFHLAQMGLDRECLSPKGLNLCSGSFKVVHLAAGKRNLRPGLGKSQGNGLADTTAAAGHNRCFTL